jgi:predicted AlkP superfamily phosphohydrolase/phosphomutase
MTAARSERSPDGAGPRVLVVAADAGDADLVDSWAEAGVLPTFARLRREAAVVDTLAPRGLFVGATWPTVATGLEADRHGYYTWLAVDPAAGGDGYQTRQTDPTEMAGTPLWVTLDRAGRRCAVLDVPHIPLTAIPPEFRGSVLVEWGCHDRHHGPASHPPDLLDELETAAGGTHFGAAAPPGFDQFAPCDYLHRADWYRTAEEDDALLATVLEGHQRTRAASLALLDRGGWDLFWTVLGESHCVGHQLWSVHDPRHPAHDPARRRRLGDPLEAVYRQLDATLAAHLERADPDTTTFVLLSHGMGPHYDGTHLLDHLLVRLDPRVEATDGAGPGWRTRLAGSVLDRLPVGVASRVAPATAALVRRRMTSAPPAPPRPAVDHEGLLDRDRSTRSWFVIPNNTVAGAIRVNVAGRDPAGVVDPADYDDVCADLDRWLRQVLNVDTGAPAVTSVVRVDRAMRRHDGDGLPDLLVEWDRSAPIERVWSPRTGTVAVAYSHWRTGDHRRSGRLFVLGPGIGPGHHLGPVSLADLAPTVAAALGVTLPDVDGRALEWAVPEAPDRSGAAHAVEVRGPVTGGWS